MFGQDLVRSLFGTLDFEISWKHTQKVVKNGCIKMADSARKLESAFLDMCLTDCHIKFKEALEKQVSGSENQI